MPTCPVLTIEPNLLGEIRAYGLGSTQNNLHHHTNRTLGWASCRMYHLKLSMKRCSTVNDVDLTLIWRWVPNLKMSLKKKVVRIFIISLNDVDLTLI